MATSSGGRRQGRGRAHAGGEAEYRIDALAQEAATTVRNVRAYQERGLVPPPRRQGRVALYGPEHLARLRLIGSLLERGYSLANIGELLRAWERGQDVGAVLGLETSLVGPWVPRSATTATTAELRGLFGRDAAAHVAEAVEVGLIAPLGDGRFRVENPEALEVGRLLVAAGVPLADVLDAARRLRAQVDAVAELFVGLVREHLVDPPGEPAAGDLGGLAALVDHLRPLALELVGRELAHALDAETRRRLGEHIARLSALDGPVQGPGAPAPEE